LASFASIKVRVEAFFFVAISWLAKRAISVEASQVAASERARASGVAVELIVTKKESFGRTDARKRKRERESLERQNRCEFESIRPLSFFVDSSSLLFLSCSR